MLRPIVAASLVLLSAVQPAQSQQIFKSFSYGQSPSEITSKTNAYECETNVLCIDNETFLQQPVSLGLRFVGDSLINVLVDVSMVDDPITQIMNPLMQGGDWVPILVANPAQGSSMDLIPTIKGAPGAPSQQQFLEFLVGAASAGSLTLTFLERTEQTQPAFQHSGSALEIFGAVPENTRSFDFVLSDADAAYYLNFYLPKKREPDVELEDF